MERKQALSYEEELARMTLKSIDKSRHNSFVMSNWCFVFKVLYGHDLLGQIERVSGEAVAKDMYDSGRLLGAEACMWAEKGKELFSCEHIQCSRVIFFCSDN